MTTQFRAIPAIAGIAIACSLWADEARYDADNPTPQETFERICSQCHPSSKAVPNSRSAEEWAVLVKRMQGHAQGGDKAFHENKVKLARYYMTKVMPETSSLLSKIMAGADPLMSFSEEAF